MSANNVARLYQAVINDVINGVRENFIDDGLDENCLLELKQTWEKKLLESKAIDSLVPEGSFLVRSSVPPGLVHQSGNLSQFAVQSAGNNIVQPTLVQYGNSEGGTKTVTLLPNKGVTIATLSQGIGQGNILSGAASAATLALPPDMANQWLQSVQRDGQTVQFQPINPNQVASGSKQITLTTQAPGSQMALATSQANKNYTLVKLPSTTSHQQPSSKQPAYTIVKMAAPPNSQQIQQSPSNMLTLIRKPTAIQSGGSQTGTTTSPNVTVLKVPAQQVVHQAQPHNPSIPMQLAPARQVGHNQQMPGHSGPGFQPALLQPRGPLIVPASSQQMTNSQFTLANSQTTATAQQVSGTFSLDGNQDTSDEDDDDDFNNNDDDDKDADDDEQLEDEDGGGEEEDPLNSNDDVSEEEGDTQDIFDIDNVVVCQYDKISRSRNKWKFQFKDGIMNLEGKDYVFQKAIGDAEW